MRSITKGGDENATAKDCWRHTHAFLWLAWVQKRTAHVRGSVRRGGGAEQDYFLSSGGAGFDSTSLFELLSDFTDLELFFCWFFFRCDAAVW